MITWIPLTGPGSRLPTREDADERGEVVWKWADGTTCTGRFEDSGDEDDPAVAWLPLPPYTPPKPGPSDEECAAFAFILDCITSRDQFSVEARRWFADVTARIEREKQT